MLRTPLAAALCALGLLTGCGSSTHKASTPRGAATATRATATSHGPPMATIGAAGTVGGGTSGDYRATRSAVLYNIRVALVKYFISKGFSGVTAHCTAVSSDSASCNIAGTNKSSQTSSAVLTLSVDQTNGALRITHVN